MMKSVGKANFPMRQQVSSPVSIRVRNKLNFDDQDVDGFFEAEGKPKVPADTARALREPCTDSIPHKTRLEYRNNS